MRTFSELFKKYRLRAEFASLSEFADAFAEKGYVYDLSIFSQWQNGKRIPTKREVVVGLIEIFIDKAAINSLDETNEFLESAGHGYLTDREQARVMKKDHKVSSTKFLFD